MIRIIAFCFILLLSACRSDMPSIPGDIIPPDKMKMILVDMHIADAVAETQAQGGASERDQTVQFYNRIYANHNITRDEFVKSFRFYQDNPILYNKLYEEMLTEMSKREADVSK